MCIIVYKPEGVDMPSRDTLLNCYRGNSDGAGFMYPLVGKDKIRIRKGFMDFGGLMDSLDRIPDVKNVPVVIHFRIGTQGLNDKGNTHPFPITSCESTLTSVESVADVALAHNGIIDLTSTYGSVKQEVVRSDTYFFVKDYCTCLCDKPNYYENEKIVEILEKLAGSKLAIMSNDGHVELIGSFIHDDEDFCYYSNTSYMGWSYSGTTAMTKYYSGGGGGWFDYDDDTDDYYNVTEAEWKFYNEHGYWPTSDDMDGGGFEERNLVRAAFAPTNAWVVDIDDPAMKMIKSSSDSFVHDKFGNVYVWDDKRNLIVKLNHHMIVDDNFDEVEPDENVMAVFVVGEKKE